MNKKLLIFFVLIINGLTLKTLWAAEATFNEGSPFWGKAGGSPGVEDLFSSSDGLRRPRIEIDSKDNFYMVWNAAGGGNIYFKKWNGSAWTKANGTYGFDTFFYRKGYNFRFYAPIIKLDSNNNPYVIWWYFTAKSNGIFFTKWNGSRWVKADGTTLGYENIAKGAGVSSNRPQIELDSLNNPYVVWEELSGGNFEIYFTRWNGSAWTKADGITLGAENLSNNAGNSQIPRIEMDSTGMPYVVWCDETTGGGDIYFTRWNGSAWTGADGITRGYDNVSNTSGASNEVQFRLGSDNKPHIAWHDGTTGGGDIYYTRWNGSTWTRADGKTRGYDNVSANGGISYLFTLFTSSFELDRNNNPHISWSDRTTGYGYIYYTRWNGHTWTKADGKTPGYDNVSESFKGDAGQSYLKLDAGGNPNIVFGSENKTNEPNANKDIHFTRWNRSAWTHADGITRGYENVSANSTVSYRPRFVLDSSGNPWIIWEDDDGDKGSILLRRFHMGGGNLR